MEESKLQRGGKVKSCSTARPAEAARPGRGSRGWLSRRRPRTPASPAQTTLWPASEWRDKRRILGGLRVLRDVVGVAVAVSRGALPVAERASESWAANGCPRGRRPAGGGRRRRSAAQLSRKKKGKSDHQDDPSQEVPHELALLPLDDATQVPGLGVPVGTAPLLCGLPLFSMFRPLVVCFPVSAARCCHQVSSKHGRSVVGRGGNGSRCRRR